MTTKPAGSGAASLSRRSPGVLDAPLPLATAWALREPRDLALHSYTPRAGSLLRSARPGCSGGAPRFTRQRLKGLRSTSALTASPRSNEITKERKTREREKIENKNKGRNKAPHPGHARGPRRAALTAKVLTPICQIPGVRAGDRRRRRRRAADGKIPASRGRPDTQTDTRPFSSARSPFQLF